MQLGCAFQSRIPLRGLTLPLLQQDPYGSLDSASSQKIYYLYFQSNSLLSLFHKNIFEHFNLKLGYIISFIINLQIEKSILHERIQLELVFEMKNVKIQIDFYTSNIENNLGTYPPSKTKQINPCKNWDSTISSLSSLMACAHYLHSVLSHSLRVNLSCSFSFSCCTVPTDTLFKYKIGVLRMNNIKQGQK